MLEDKAGQEEAVQAASAKLEAIEDFNDQLSGKVNYQSRLRSKICARPSLQTSLLPL